MNSLWRLGRPICLWGIFRRTEAYVGSREDAVPCSARNSTREKIKYFIGVVTDVLQVRLSHAQLSLMFYSCLDAGVESFRV